MNFELLAITSAAVFAATVFQSIAGFGYAIIGVPILSAILGPKEAVIFLLISGTYMRALLLYKVRKEVTFSVVKYLFLGSLLGVIPGNLLLKYVSPSVLNIILGCTLILAVILLSLKVQWKTVYERLEQIFFGVIGGFFTASTGVGGPPVAFYMIHAERAKEEARADLVCYFVMCNIWAISVGYIVGNNNVGDLLGLPLWSLPAGILGMYVGEKVFRLINQELFNKITMLAIILSAITMMYKGLSS